MTVEPSRRPGGVFRTTMLPGFTPLTAALLPLSARMVICPDKGLPSLDREDEVLVFVRLQGARGDERPSREAQGVAHRADRAERQAAARQESPATKGHDAANGGPSEDWLTFNGVVTCHSI